MTGTDPTDRQVIRDLTNKSTVTDDVLAELRRRLSERADRDGILDLSYRTIDSPVGSLLLAATPAGVVRVAFEVEDHDQVLSTLATKISPRMLETGRRTDDIARQLNEYFDGKRHDFDLDVDLQLITGFRNTVISHLSEIPYGTTASYSQVAAMVGNPAAVRAVGSACGHNPLPLVIPCHRVIRSDGTTGQYLGGTDAKATLLSFEAAA